MTDIIGVPGRHCEIIPIERHDPDGVTTGWAVRDLGAEKIKADGFGTADEARGWAVDDGYEEVITWTEGHGADQADPITEAVDVLFRNRHSLPSDALRSLRDIWFCASTFAARSLDFLSSGLLCGRSATKSSGSKTPTSSAPTT